ncbi:MAG: radical SAM protein [Candidatus Thermoplasmatota archaeon]
MYDPIKLSEKIEKLVTEDNKRKYYRFRPARWYGGIVTGDVLGCNLFCAFCWFSDVAREKPESIGKFYSSERAFSILDIIAKKRKYTQMRLSGGEPTIGKEHLLELISLVDKTNYSFILETNGLLIGYDENYAKELKKFKNLHVRVSFKGTNEQEFSYLTSAKPEFFNLQLKALENLINANVACHPAVMISFSKLENFDILKLKFREISEELAESLEIEELILYPHVVKRLEKKKIKWRSGYRPNSVPKELV